MLLPRLDIAELRHREPRPIGLSGFHPIIARKGQLGHLLHRDWLHGFIRCGEDPCFKVAVARLLDHIGQRHERIRIFQVSSQGANTLFDRPIILLGGTGSFRRSDQSFGEQREDGEKHLLAGRLCPQDTPRLLHFAAHLAAAMPTGVRPVSRRVHSDL